MEDVEENWHDALDLTLDLEVLRRVFDNIIDNRQTVVCLEDGCIRIRCVHPPRLEHWLGWDGVTFDSVDVPEVVV